MVYRVRVGPFERREDAENAKEKLGDSGVDSALVARSEVSVARLASHFASGRDSPQAFAPPAMTLTRRDFSAGCSAPASPASCRRGARAQAAPVEGVHYVRLAAAGGRGRCRQDRGDRVLLVRVPALQRLRAGARGLDQAPAPTTSRSGACRSGSAKSRSPPSSASSTPWRALGLVPTLHRKVFQAIHSERIRLRTPEDIAAFALKNGVDPITFMTAYNSFAVAVEVAAGAPDRRGLQDRRGAGDGRPGRYYTNGNLANAGRRRRGRTTGCSRVVDTLVARVRQGSRA